ncbi:hypothetical protein ABTC27_19145, partial [Acinetobacter baumannii]
FTPYLGVKLLPSIKGHGDPHAIYETRMYRALRGAVRQAVRHRFVVIAITVSAFLASIAGMAFVQQQFFPTSSRPELFIETRMPEGSSIGATA